MLLLSNMMFCSMVLMCTLLRCGHGRIVLLAWLTPSRFFCGHIGDLLR